MTAPAPASRSSVPAVILPGVSVLAFIAALADALAWPLAFVTGVALAAEAWQKRPPR